MICCAGARVVCLSVDRTPLIYNTSPLSARRFRCVRGPARARANQNIERENRNIKGRNQNIEWGNQNIRSAGPGGSKNQKIDQKIRISVKCRFYEARQFTDAIILSNSQRRARRGAWGAWVNASCPYCYCTHRAAAAAAQCPRVRLGRRAACSHGLCASFDAREQG